MPTRGSADGTRWRPCRADPSDLCWCTTEVLAKTAWFPRTL